MPRQQIAKVLKANGTDGAILIGCRDISPEDISLEEPVFVYFDGLPVPFFVNSLVRRGNSKAIVTLDGVTSLRDAEELVGQAVWADYFEGEEEEEGLDELVGWTLKGAGTIVDFVDIPANPCLEVETANGTKVLVPFNEELVISADPETKELVMEIPAGLI